MADARGTERPGEAGASEARLSEREPRAPKEDPDWSRFRGPNGTGIADTSGLPSEFGPAKNVMWKAAVPSGHSSPVLWGVVTSMLSLIPVIGSAAVSLPVVGPSTPSNFETRNTGVTLEVEPVVGPDGVTIDLNLVPQVVEFEGFINYGSPIKTVNPALLGFSPSTLLGTTTQSITLTDNVINQPIFSTRKVTTSVSVWDGQTVVLGGLMREDVQKVEDRTPLLGDIPMVGRLFRTNVDQHIKRNLIIFVTARLVNPAGQPVNQTEEEEEQETVQPPVLPEIPAYKK